MHMYRHVQNQQFLFHLSSCIQKSMGKYVLVDVVLHLEQTDQSKHKIVVYNVYFMPATCY